MSADPTTLVEGRAFLEGPRWHDGAVWMSDMYDQEVLRVVPGAPADVVARVDGDPSGLGFLPDGSLLVVSMRDRRLLRRDGETLEVRADCAAVAPFEINDLVVDRHGHAFISQFGFDFHGGAPYRTAPLLRVDPDGSVHEATDGLRMANGLVITGDGATLVVAESTGKDLVGFDLAADGTLSNRRVWAELPEYPDGISIDAADGVWVASPVGDRCVRVVEGGEVTDAVDFPGRHTIACAVGGSEQPTLFVCTSATHGQRDLSRELRSAALEAVPVAVGAP